MGSNCDYLQDYERSLQWNFISYALRTFDIMIRNLGGYRVYIKKPHNLCVPWRDVDEDSDARKEEIINNHDSDL